MFLLFPKRCELKTSLTSTQCRKKLNSELVEYNRKPSLIAVNRFIKTHRFECCYFGSWDKNGKFELFYHRAKKHDGSSAGFFGTIEKTDGGSVIKGSVRRSAAVCIAAAVWCLLLLLMILSMIALKIYDGAACCGALFLVGLALIAYDGSEKYIKSYLESFPPINN